MRLHSDIRLKTNIERIGTLPSGLPVYSYNYAWSPKQHIGVMAQEALLLFPEAVSELDVHITLQVPGIQEVGGEVDAGVIIGIIRIARAGSSL